MSNSPPPRILPPALSERDLANYASLTPSRDGGSAHESGLQQELAKSRREQSEKIASATTRAANMPTQKDKRND